MTTSSGDRERDFGVLYAEHFDAVLGFALRRTDRPEDAADVVADTFLVAWRRLAHVPPGHEARPWLYGVARRVLANQRRGGLRRAALGSRLRHELVRIVPDRTAESDGRLDVAAALRRLSARDQEVLELHLWEQLEPREIAEVLGLTTVVVRPRLSRARARLRSLLESDGNDPPSGGHLSSRQPHPVRKES
ncbi:RNA polymerase sigma factor [Nocardioides sp. R-C-SC26]|uniref:RNA polymerase sigma factor n=1 Tax=Nocardioides sp. R-C-SC26 TaxID=2870414 RepID=UPI001E2C5C4B|nr:sigma-70 family RNA polymerase sigma factor [Nocardioides sp. R-C-SC26]